MKIGELAKQTHTPVVTIRYYEKTGLLKEPLRSDNNYRDYTQAHVDRLRFIRNCRALDLNHEEIRALLVLSEQSGCCEQAVCVVTEHIHHVESRIRELEELRQRLYTLNAQCKGEPDYMPCGILRALITADDTESPPAPHTHSKQDYL